MSDQLNPIRPPIWFPITKAANYRATDLGLHPSSADWRDAAVSIIAAHLNAPTEATREGEARNGCEYWCVALAGQRVRVVWNPLAFVLVTVVGVVQ